MIDSGGIDLRVELKQHRQGDGGDGGGGDSGKAGVSAGLAGQQASAAMESARKSNLVKSAKLAQVGRGGQRVLISGCYVEMRRGGVARAECRVLFSPPFCFMRQEKARLIQVKAP